jgi:hypothetical protein
MSRSIQVVIAPGLHAARVIATEGPTRTLLTAHLAPATTHPRALPWLLEALALWEGATVRAVLAVDEAEPRIHSSMLEVLKRALKPWSCREARSRRQTSTARACRSLLHQTRRARRRA